MPDAPLTLDLRRLLLRTLFLASPAPPVLYVGLVERSPEGEVTMAKLAAAEIRARNYQRQPIMAGRWELLYAPPQASAEVFFSNGSGKPDEGDLKTWPKAEGVFLATTADDTGAVIAFAPLAPGRVLFAGDRLRVPVTVEL